jgi:pSer/pThr/pTyr-binding forkhead associated (FHA) protein
VVGISRFHCQIKRLGGKLLLEDLGSTNGTHLNDDPIDAPCELSVGDKVTLCDVTLIFHNNDDIS